jgi:arsenite methyltransferase
MGTISTSSCLLKRPGGFDITHKALKYCAFQHGDRILDLGCGSGATVDYMNSALGLIATGIDIDETTPPGKSNIIKAKAQNIPFPDLHFDGIISECSFSLMEDRERVLNECHRVLREDGRLIISDMYARGTPVCLTGALGMLDTKENIISLLQRCGFITDLFEDFTHSLQTMWGQMIFDKGAKSFYNEIGINPDEFKKIKCGYCLIVATKVIAG